MVVRWCPVLGYCEAVADALVRTSVVLQAGVRRVWHTSEIYAPSLEK
jgi:hypothetical protein